jgi:23S rRNA pseudouridine1911/1915/1917 synthase
MIYTDAEQQRIDVFLTKNVADHSRSVWQEYIEKGFIKVNGKVIKSKYKLSEGDEIDLNDAEINKIKILDTTIKPLDIALDIAFENENLLVVNKPAGLITHPGAGNHDGTLVNALVNKYNLSDCGGAERLGILHRLDKDTSGLIIVAKNNVAHTKIAKQIETKSCKRKYLALCFGVFVPSSGNITTNIAPQKNDHRKMEVVAEGTPHSKTAITNYKTIEIFCDGAVSLVEFSLETGRTHQIRVHALHSKHPLIGDKVYVSNKYRYCFEGLSAEKKQLLLNFDRQALHSYYLNFTEPVTRKKIELEIDLPTDMQDLIKQLR